jgi:hypothetical protein
MLILAKTFAALGIGFRFTPVEVKEIYSMSRIGTAICMLFVLAESIPVFAAKHDIDQATVGSEGGFSYKITKPRSYKLTSNFVVPAGTDGSTFFPKMSL